MTSPTSEEIRHRLHDLCCTLIRPRIGYEISGEVVIKGEPFGLCVGFDTHLDKFIIHLDAGFYIEAVVLDETERPEIWRPDLALSHAIPILERHLVLDQIADV